MSKCPNCEHECHEESYPCPVEGCECESCTCGECEMEHPEKR